MNSPLKQSKCATTMRQARDMRLTSPSLILALSILSVVFTFGGRAQIVYVPLDQSVYGFLQRTYARGFHSLNGEVIPYSTMQVASALAAIEKNDSLLSQREKEELEFHKTAFKKELHQIDSTIQTEDRWNLVNYNSSNMAMVLNPVAGITLENGIRHTYTGAALSGDFGGIVGFSFRFHDNGESGNNIDAQKKDTPETGINIVSRPDPKTIQYSDVTATIGVGWTWGAFSIGKDYINWGMGNRGKLILSSKAPSFPFLRLDLHPTDWLRFYYLHGWLQSDVVDSLRTYSSRLANKPRYIYREKYIAAHLVSVSITGDLTVSFGESIIYSDMPPNIMFLNPFLFYRAIDHYLTRNYLGDGNNSQFFGNIDYRLLHSTQLYGTLFIDEINTDKIFNDAGARNQLGFTVGTRTEALARYGVSVNAEYTRILPWVYSNFVQTQVYESSSYLLGHYIGQNADQIYAEIIYRPTYNSSVQIYYDYVRKGGLTDIAHQYQLPSMPFLYGNVDRRTVYGFSGQYEVYYDLKVRVFGEYSSHRAKKVLGGIALSYGLSEN